MPGYTRSESGVKKSDFYKKFEFWLGALALLVAGYAAITADRASDQAEESNRVATEVFEWQKEQVRLAEQIDFAILGEWMCEKLVVWDFTRGPGVVTAAGDSLQFGIYARVILKLGNLSRRTTTIDRMSVGYVTPNGVMTEGWGKLLRTATDTAKARFPVILDPGEQTRFTVYVPVPVTDSVASLLSQVTKQALYPCDSILGVVSSGIGNPLGDFMHARYLPELLTGGEHYKHIRGDRQLEISIALASGEVHHDTLDYIDINRWLIDF